MAKLIKPGGLILQRALRGKLTFNGHTRVLYLRMQFKAVLRSLVSYTNDIGLTPSVHRWLSYSLR
jgi:hypothetical protein